MKLYGQEFELVGEPIVMGDNLVFVDAIEKKSGQLRRVRIPLTTVNMANGERSAASVAGSLSNSPHHARNRFRHLSVRRAQMIYGTNAATCRE